MEGPVTDGVLKGTAKCARPPKGWYCSKPAGHDGECKLWPEIHNVSRETGP